MSPAGGKTGDGELSPAGGQTGDPVLITDTDSDTFKLLLKHIYTSGKLALDQVLYNVLTT